MDLNRICGPGNQPEPVPLFLRFFRLGSTNIQKLQLPKFRPHISHLNGVDDPTPASGPTTSHQPQSQGFPLKTFQNLVKIKLLSRTCSPQAWPCRHALLFPIHPQMHVPSCSCLGLSPSSPPAILLCQLLATSHVACSGNPFLTLPPTHPEPAAASELFVVLPLPTPHTKAP